MTDAEQKLIALVATRIREGQSPTNADLIMISDLIGAVRDERIGAEAVRLYIVGQPTGSYPREG